MHYGELAHGQCVMARLSKVCTWLSNLAASVLVLRLCPMTTGLLIATVIAALWEKLPRLQDSSCVLLNMYTGTSGMLVVTVTCIDFDPTLPTLTVWSTAVLGKILMSLLVPRICMVLWKVRSLVLWLIGTRPTFCTSGLFIPRWNMVLPVTNCMSCPPCRHVGPLLSVKLRQSARPTVRMVFLAKGTPLLLMTLNPTLRV